MQAEVSGRCDVDNKMKACRPKGRFSKEVLYMFLVTRITFCKMQVLVVVQTDWSLISSKWYVEDL